MEIQLDIICSTILQIILENCRGKSLVKLSDLVKTIPKFTAYTFQFSKMRNTWPMLYNIQYENI